MPEYDNSEKDSEFSSRSNPAAYVLSALVLYVLSIGPYAALSTRTGMDTSFVRWIYYPVDWLHDNTWLKEPLEAYVELWL